MGYQFYAPQWLWLLLLIPILLYFNHLRLTKEKGNFKFSKTTKELVQISFLSTRLIINGTYIFIGLGLFFLILSMALPYAPIDEKQRRYDKGIEIMIAMDVSGSMMATDFLPNRLEAAKLVAINFIQNRTSDQIGFVAFAGEAYTVCPTTQDYTYLERKINSIQPELIKQGTAIGEGLGTAVAQIYQDTITSKVIILLTDGINNSGTISPLAAAQLAKDNHIRVYTIGVGKKGYAKMPIQTPFGTIMKRNKVNIDEQLLTQISKETGGAYFRAVDKESLEKIYHKINQLEKSKLVSKIIHQQPPFRPKTFIIFGIILLFIGIIIEQLILRKNA